MSVEYHADEGHTEEMVAALEAARFSRRRTGATSSRVPQDAATRGELSNSSSSRSWDEHLRQHERVSVHDQDRLDKVQALTNPSQPTTVTHWLTPSPEHAPDIGDSRHVRDSDDSSTGQVN